MLAVVEVDAGQAAKRGEAADEEGQRTPPRELVAAARKHRQPTPDHPPYCWMIGEAIDALAEDGGSTEDSISAFICARYPGVPPAHDRLLRHYLGKHVAEGFFVRTAAGRYELVPEENADEELPVEQAEAGSWKPAPVGSKVVEVKRGRGRPPSTPPASRKDGRTAAAQWTTPPAGSSSALVAAAKDSVPMSPVAVADKDEVQAPSLKPKRRRRRRRIPGLGMATTTDSSGEALVAGKKDGSEVPYTLDKERELALVILGDRSAASTMDKACTEVPPPTTPPVDGGQPLNLALVTTTEVPVPAPMPAMDKDGGDASSIMDKNAPMPAMDKDSGDASSIVVKNDSICTTATVPEPGSRVCKLALMDAAAAADGFVRLLFSDKKDGLKEAPSASYKDVRQPHKATSAPTAGKKVGGKALSATPKGCRRQRKSAPVIAGGCPTPASVTDQGSREASVMLKQRDQPRKLYPVTADKISDDPRIALLALPSQALAPLNL